MPLDERDHYALWTPMMRVPVQSGVIAQQALDTFPAPWPIIMLFERLQGTDVNPPGDALVNEVADRLQAAGRTDIWCEFGNELNGVESAKDMNTWYQRSIQRLSGIVAVDHLITCGVGNIDPHWIPWIKESIQGLPQEMLIGFHPYGDDFIQQRAAFVSILGGRTCFATEGGSFNLEPESESVPKVQSLVDSVYAMPCAGFIWYANNSGSQPNQDFGLHNQFTDQWRLEVEQVLIQARRP